MLTRVCVLVTVLFLFSAGLPCDGSVNTLRVLIAKGVKEAGVSIMASCRVLNRDTAAVLYDGRIGGGVIRAEGGKIVIAGKSFNADSLLLDFDAPFIRINTRDYRGEIQVSLRNAGLDLVNNISTQNYTKGVLFHEASPYWPIEMLKAQAVVVRTYACYIAQKSADKDFDLTADVYSQVYGGSTFERSRPNRAVDETESLVLKYGNSVIPAFFHSTCAGHTESASELWDINIASLEGVPCKFCALSPYYKWSRRISLVDLQAALNKKGIAVRGMTGIRVSGKTAGGRAREIVVSDKLREYALPCKDFRIFVGPDKIRSTNFSVSTERDYANFEGFGWGHGVGLCQWGGYFMAKDGKSFRQILEYYYPGAQIGKL